MSSGLGKGGQSTWDVGKGKKRTNETALGGSNRGAQERERE